MMRNRTRILAVVAALTAGAGAAAAAGATLTPAAAGVPVATLSTEGPFPGGTWYGPHRVVIRTEGPVAATSLAALRAVVGCSAGGPCWGDAHVPARELLVAVAVGGCGAATGASGTLVTPATLVLDVHYGPAPEACTGLRPRLWLLGAPLSGLPRHRLLTVEVDGARTTVPLP
jgi:hypothetical protein